MDELMDQDVADLNGIRQRRRDEDLRATGT
jgi:hypothetical protein